VEWNEDARTFAINALNPAKVSRVSITDEKEKIMEVIVEDKQLSLAIGKRGQNVRLAARLIGWRIDIKSEEEKKREVETQMTAMTAQTDIRALSGIGEKTAERLLEHGFTSVEQIASVTTEKVMEVPGVGLKTAERVVAMASEYLERIARESLPAGTAGEIESEADMPAPDTTLVVETNVSGGLRESRGKDNDAESPGRISSNLEDRNRAGGED
jgi:N utilization substance protein A